MSISEKLNTIKNSLPQHVQLVAVSKTKPVSDLWEAYNCGQRIFGENKVQELTQKQAELPKDIQWHFIGHLQSNKVKYIAPFVNLIHGVDSLKLLSVIFTEAKKNNRLIPCLLQIHIAKEETKFGLSFEEVNHLLSSAEYQTMESESQNGSGIIIAGLMGMATFTDDLDSVHAEFNSLSKYFKELKTNYFAEKDTFKEISMGMSDDYLIAIEEGSTMVRVGSSIFGHRNYAL